MKQNEQRYENVFNHRGGSYAAAMEMCPDARRHEFEALFRHVPLGEVRRVADVPSGSSYLGRYLPPSVTVHAYDPSHAFREAGDGVYQVDLEQPKLLGNDYDLIVSLAGIHHVEDKSRFFGDLVAHVAPGGRIVLADVGSGSRVARFLDGFVGEHNGTGHAGMFLAEEDPFDFGRAHPRVVGATVETLAVPWLFGNEEEMAQFCSLLFGTDAGPTRMADALAEAIGVSRDGSGCSLRWELTYITVELGGRS
jgi:SAM-dependent methyltransferase